MRISCLAGACLGLLPSLLGAASEPASILIARIHYAGEERVKQNEDGKTLREILQLPATGDLRAEVMNKLAAGAAKFVLTTAELKENPPEANTAVLRTALDDLFQAETWLEVSEAGAGRRVWGLALRLAEDRGKLWETNLWQWAESLKMGMPSPREGSSEGVSSWGLSLTNGGFALRHTRAGGWTVVELIDGESAGESGLVSRIKADGGPAAAKPGEFWSGSFNLEKLGGLAGLRSARGWPVLELAAKGRGDGVRTEGVFRFSEARTWILDNWQVPTNSIRDPLISFTAAQGFAPWILRQDWLKDLEWTAIPNQIFAWGNTPNILMQVFAAIQVPDATNSLKRFTERWAPPINAHLLANGVGELKPATNSLALTWHGLPYLIPFLKPAPDANFLLAGLVPLAQSPFTNPPPAELLAQIEGRTNLLYYDWEITQPRLMQFREFSPLLPLLLTLSPMAHDSAANRWLDAVEPRLGETVTEITVDSPTELKVIRKAHAGFNALELLALGQWVSSPNFPALNVGIGFRPPPASRKAKVNPSP